MVKMHCQPYDLKPKVKGRPRMTKKGHTYTPKDTVEFENRVKDGWDGPTYEGPVRVAITLGDDGFAVTVSEIPNPPESKLRGDIDNYAKSILDGLQGKAFLNDKQVRSLEVYKK